MSAKGVDKSEKRDIILLPDVDKAVIPLEKFTGYALNPEKDADKATAFKEALGYDMTNADKLIAKIREQIKTAEAVEKGDGGYGMKYETLLEILGENGKKANVKVGWIRDKEKNQTRLTSVYVTKKRRKTHDED